MLDELVGNSPPFGGVQLRSSQAHLVDDSDEGTRSHRGPDGEDSRANHPSVCLGHENRGRGNEEQVTQEVGVVALAERIGIGAGKNAGGGVEIGQSGAADVNLQRGPLQEDRVRCAASMLLDDPHEDTTDAR